MINVSVYDQKTHKLQENYTHKGISLDQIQAIRQNDAVLTNGSGKKAKKLTFKSVHLANEEVDNLTSLAVNEKDNEQESHEDQDIAEIQP